MCGKAATKSPRKDLKSSPWARHFNHLDSYSLSTERLSESRLQWECGTLAGGAIPSPLSPRPESYHSQLILAPP